MALMRLVRVAVLVLALFSSSTAAFSIDSFHSRSPSRIWMGADAPSPRRPLKQSSASEIALKIGLNIAPKGSTKKNTMNGGKKKEHKQVIVKDLDHAVPVISWGRGMKRFFWGESSQSIPSEGLRSSPKMTMHQIGNKESFPLVLLRGALSSESLAWALSLTADGNSVSDAEEIEQHEQLAGGRVRALRRSLVSQLDPKGELLDGILSNLPVALVGGHDHPYEDGSIVYYRRREDDFYDEHHDSYAPGETPRDRQRAYTILIYLRTPSGPPSVGGTEFTRLTLRDDDDNDNENVACAAGRKGGKGLVVKPSAGDALVWPNFDRDGNPYKDSVHRALPVTALPTARKESRDSAAQIGNTEEDGIGKVVVNLWFEGFTKSRNS
jgi:hypothetical protein